MLFGIEKNNRELLGASEESRRVRHIFNRLPLADPRHDISLSLRKGKLECVDVTRFFVA